MTRMVFLSMLLAAAHLAGAADSAGGQRSLLSSRAVVAFSGKGYDGWEQWDWNSMTHLAFWSNPPDEARKQARANNVKLFKDNGAHLDVEDWTDQQKVSDAVALIKQQMEDDDLDGTFVDHEGNGLSSAQKKAYTDYVSAIQQAIAPKEIFVCVGGRPDYEWRNYDYKGLAEASSFLFIMGYDMHFWDDYSCVGSGTCSPAEAPLADLKKGVKGYLDEVDADKLVLGLPWYGQRYTQVLGVEANQGQVDLADVWPIIYGDKTDRKKSHTFYDNDKDCAWKLMCNGACLDGHKGGVIWYDDEESLAKKYAIAADNNLLGVGIWEVDKLDYSGKFDKYVEKMWSALGSYAAVASNATIAV